MKIFLFILLSVLLLLLVSGGYTFFTACRRRKEHPWFSKEELSRTSFGKYYPSIIATDVWLKEKNAREISMLSRDGLCLRALWIGAENAIGTILLAHGYRSTFLVDFSKAFASYHQKGLNILVPYQRAHGKSEGRYITFGVKESDDFLQWVEYHNENLSTAPIVLSGMSMGATTVLMLADADLPQNVKGIIADCGFTSPKAIIGEIFHKVVHLPAWVCMWAADLFAAIFAGFRLSEKDTRKSLANSKVPVLMVHGKADDFVPCSMTEEGYDACIAPKKLLLVDGAGHGVSYIVAQKEYSALIDEFLNEILSVKGE